MPRGIEWALAMLAKDEARLRALADDNGELLSVGATCADIADSLKQVQEALTLPAPETEPR